MRDKSPYPLQSSLISDYKATPLPPPPLLLARSRTQVVKNQETKDYLLADINGSNEKFSK
jgi:hypothetical protein